MERTRALIRREVIRMIASKSWLVMTAAQPIAYLLLLGVGLASQFGDVVFGNSQLRYISFILPGLVALQTNQLFHVLVSLSSADRRFGVFSLVMMAGTRPWEYMSAQILAHGLIAAIQGILILLIGFALVGQTISVAHLGVRIVAWLVAWLASLVFWSSLGLMIGLRIEREEKRDVLWALLNLPIMFSSSVFYNVRQAPTVIRLLSYVNPLTYCADVLRSTMYGDPLAVAWEGGLLVGLAVVAVWFCHRIVLGTPLTRTVG